MKKIISIICLILTLATLLCACDGEEPIETQPLADSSTTSAPETTKTPETTAAPAPAVKKTYVDFDGTLSVKSSRVSTMDIKAFEGEGGYYKHAQGGCIAGDYLITCMHSPAVKATENTPAVPEKVCVVKSDLKTGEIVAKSENMSLGHGNDATYNPDDNVIVVADCGSNGHNVIHILDADTLALKKSVVLPRGSSGSTICAIAYDDVNKRYIAIGAQNDYVYIYNRFFQLTKTIKGFGMTQGDPYDGEFSEQGILTDGTYLYILEWHGGSQWPDVRTIEKEVRANILVMDLSTGAHVATIETGIKRELEFAVYRNGKIYIGCNNINWNGMEFYKVEITTTKN